VYNDVYEITLYLVSDRKPLNSHFWPEYWRYLFWSQITPIPFFNGLSH